MKITLCIVLHCIMGISEFTTGLIAAALVSFPVPTSCTYSLEHLSILQHTKGEITL